MSITTSGQVCSAVDELAALPPSSDAEVDDFERGRWLRALGHAAAASMAAGNSQSRHGELKSHSRKRGRNAYSQSLC
jgi:hypothetical protein